MSIETDTACLDQAAREHPDPVLTAEEKLAFLVFHAYQGATVSEGVLAHALADGDRIAVRKLREEGEAVDERLREARVARAKAYARLKGHPV